MPEFRQDPLSGRWVIIAEDRAGRPSEFVSQPTCRPRERCPFCAGNEEDTPNAIATYGTTERGIESTAVPGARWQVRVIPNKYPAAVARQTLQADRLGEPGLSPVLPGVGIHEVIIESPRHVASFAELTDEQARCSLVAYRDRLRNAGQDPNVKYGLVFKNCRGGGGATLEHAHSQLLATSIVPHEAEQEWLRATAFIQERRQCLTCSLLKEELSTGLRIVAETAEFVAYCPFASRFPYELWIVPRRHASHFQASSDDLLYELTELLQIRIGSLERFFPETAYNFWIHTGLFRVADDESGHWRIVLIPRVTTQAGYEWATGCFVNPVSPETAASKLR